MLIEKHVDRNVETSATFVDLQKVFGKVNHFEHFGNAGSKWYTWSDHWCCMYCRLQALLEISVEQPLKRLQEAMLVHME